MSELRPQSNPGMPGGPPLPGRRLPDATWDEPGAGWDAWNDAQPGDYMKILDPPSAVENASTPGAMWYIRDPYGHVGTLRTHRVDEHEDGTITVTPSILDPSTYTGDELRAMGIVSIISEDRVSGWHGYLERGQWRSV